MANEMKVSVGTFVKKKINDLGVLTKEKVPFLPKTLAKLVFLGDGESVDHAVTTQRTDINNLTSNVTDLTNVVDQVKSGELGITKSFDTFEDYQKALSEGEVSNSTICAILDDNASPDNYMKNM